MATNKAEAIHFMKIIHDWVSPKVARMMMDDLDFFIADTTDNESIKKSIKMVRDMVYARAEENLEIEGEARIMDDIYAFDIDWTTPVMVTFLVMAGLGFWSYLCWESFRN